MRGVWIFGRVDADQRHRRSGLYLDLYDRTKTEAANVSRILLATDGSHCAASALEQAIALARATRAEVDAFFVADDSEVFFQLSPGHWPAPSADSTTYGRRVLSKTGERLGAAGVRWTSRLSMARTTPKRLAAAILDEAERRQADLIVMGVHGHHGIRGVLLGSVVEQVVRETLRPVLLVPEAAGCGSR